MRKFALLMFCAFAGVGVAVVVLGVTEFLLGPPDEAAQFVAGLTITLVVALEGFRGLGDGKR